MSRRGNSSTPKLDLKLNLSPPTTVYNNNNNNNQRVEFLNGSSVTSSSNSSSSSEMSPKSSCVSSEVHQDVKSSPAGSSSMLLVGCTRCLMYLMLSDVNPKCPKCKSTVLLDVHYEETSKKATN